MLYYLRDIAWLWLKEEECFNKHFSFFHSRILKKTNTVSLETFLLLWRRFNRRYLRKRELGGGGGGDWGVVDLVELQGTSTEVRRHTWNNKNDKKTIFCRIIDDLKLLARNEDVLHVNCSSLRTSALPIKRK